MWNKYRSFFMLVRVRTGQYNFNIPLALFLLDQTFDVISDLVWLWERVIPSGAIRVQRSSQNTSTEAFGDDFKIIPSQILQLCREIVTELRCYGKWRMVEVEVGTFRVYVDFI